MWLSQIKSKFHGRFCACGKIVVGIIIKDWSMNKEFNVREKIFLQFKCIESMNHSKKNSSRNLIKLSWKYSVEKLFLVVLRGKNWLLKDQIKYNLVTKKKEAVYE